MDVIHTNVFNLLITEENLEYSKVKFYKLNTN